MPVFRLLLAGLVAVFALFATLFAAALVVFTGLVGFFIQLFRPRSRSSAASSPAPAGRRAARSQGDVIDVVATQVPADDPKLKP